MTTTTNGHAPMVASLAVVRALLDTLPGKNYTRGVLGVQAAAEWQGPERFAHRGQPVRVVACPSTLAVWEAIEGADADAWTVVLTPCDREDLGGGVLAHLIGARLRTPDPWQAVQQRFAAERLDRRLYLAGTRPRELAAGLLAALPEAGATPAPGGVLTREHALGCVASGELGVVDPGTEVDVTAVLAWSVLPEATGRFAGLRSMAGDALADEMIDWLAGRCGSAAAPVGALLRAGKVAEIVPLGILAGLLSSPDVSASHAAGQFAGTYGLGRLSPDVLAAWHAEAAGLVTTWHGSDLSGKVLAAASTHARELGLDELARGSSLLPEGLRARLAELATAARSVLPAEPGSGVDGQLVTADLAGCERALERVLAHYLARSDDTVRAFEAALRLLRWLAADVTLPPAAGVDLAALVRRQIAEDAWVDAAVNEVARGSTDPELAAVLGHILAVVRVRRDAHDRAFGAALAATPEPDGLTVERVLPDIVLPLAKQVPALLLVLDGLSAAVATRLVADAAQAGWVESALPGRDARGGAVAVLPTLTEFSRCSLLCGELQRGSDDAERQGFAALLRGYKLDGRTPGAGADVPLFHKQRLDTSRAGQSLDTSVQTAIADTEKLPLVGAVLNAVDDALHHTDPGGIDWSLQTVRHLRPLLDAARRASRSVVITSDHGHVIERRDGELRKHTATYGARARAAATGEPATDGEVAVRGSRVVTGDRSAVLAVNERLRYGPLNAGYHGGGSPAEAVVPVILLHPGAVPRALGGAELTDPAPVWWQPGPAADAASAAPAALFEVQPRRAERDAAKADDRAARAVVASRTFAAQRANAGRIPMADESIVALLAALLAAPGRRVPARRAAAVLDLSQRRFPGALALLKRVLDVEGYVVLSYEPESGDVVLDEAMLREQFGVAT